MESVVVVFSSPEMTAEKFDKVWDELRTAGQANPKGLISHVGFAKPDGTWNVMDIWESAAAFAEFGKVLVPIMQSNMDNIPEPAIFPAHYVYVGHQENVHA